MCSDPGWSYAGGHAGGTLHGSEGLKTLICCASKQGKLPAAKSTADHSALQGDTLSSSS